MVVDISMSDYTIPLVLSADQIKAELDVLTQSGLLCGWHHEGRYWFIDSMGKRWRYTKAGVCAWLDGAHSMGAW